MVGQRTDGIFATVQAEASAKGPVNGFFDGVVKEVWEEGYDGETELEPEKEMISISSPNVVRRTNVKKNKRKSSNIPR
jgi:hypothetical protein